MNVKKLMFFAALTAVLASGCASNSQKLIKKGLYNCNSRFETAMKRMEKKNYSDAIRILDEIKYQCGGSSLMDTVYYHTAMSHFKLRQYAEARVEFENLQHEFPRSPFVEEAHYRLGQMRYLKSNKSSRDQTETLEAVRLMGDYVDLYPNGAYADSARYFHALAVEKLAEKEFRNGMFYRKQKEYEASLIYFRSLLAQYPQSKYTSEALVGSAEALAALGQAEDARELIEELEAADFSEPLKKRIEAVILKLNQPLKPTAATAESARGKARQQQEEVQPASVEVLSEEEVVEVETEEQAETEKADVGGEQAQPETEKADVDTKQIQPAAEKTDVNAGQSQSSTEKAEVNTDKASSEPQKIEAETEKKAAEPQKTE